MKVSVSLPDEDVEFLDAYVDSQGFASALGCGSQGCSVASSIRTRSGVRGCLSGVVAYEADVWEPTVGDGLS